MKNGVRNEGTGKIPGVELIMPYCGIFRACTGDFGFEYAFETRIKSSIGGVEGCFDSKDRLHDMQSSNMALLIISAEGLLPIA